MAKKILPFLIVLLISISASWGFLHHGFVPTHDAEYHIIRLWQFDRMVKSGDLFPRWAPDLNSGRGVPLFNFFYPLPNYVGEFFHILGFSFIDSIKLTLALGMIMASLLFYLWAKSLWGSWAGVVGAIFYTLAPYHLLDLYVRGTPGEIWALAFVPAVLWAIEQKRPVLGGIFLALLILAHNILAIIFFPFIISYAGLVIFLAKEKKYSILNTLYTILMGLSLSAFFWLPALVEAKYVTGLSVGNFSDHFPAFFQLLFPSWGTGFSVPGIMDEMSFQIGIPHLLVVLVTLFFLRKTPYLPFLFSWFMIIVFFLLEISSPVWKLIPGSDLIQYPWRLLSLVIFTTSGTASVLIFCKQSKVLAVTLIFLALIFYEGYTKPVTYAQRNDDFYLANPDWTTGTATLGNSFSTIWLPTSQISKEKRMEISAKQAKIEKENFGPTSYSFQTTSSVSAKIKVNTAYFPGWRVWVNGKENPVDFSQGLINFEIPAGQNWVEVKFTNTRIRSIASSISLLGLVFIGTLGMIKKRTDK